MPFIELEISVVKAKELEKMRLLLGMRREEDLYRYGYELLKDAVRERQRGRVLASVDESKGKWKRHTNFFLKRLKQVEVRKRAAKKKKKVVTKSGKQR